MNGRKASETDDFVTDMDAAIDFCTRVAGFKVIERNDFGFALLDVESKIGLLEVAKFENSDLIQGKFPRPRLAIQVRDFKAATTELAAKGVKVGSVVGAERKSQCAHLFLADGNSIFLWEDVSGKVVE